MFADRTFRFCALLICLIYTAAYFYCSATPGNDAAHPLGWWGWWDQGEYIKSARAFLALDFRPEQHLYPPLYPALGALGLKLSSGHPYFFPNLFLLLVTFYCYWRFAALHVSALAATSLFFASVVLNPIAFVQFIIPWTTILSGALFAIVILSLVWVSEYRSGRNRAPIALWKIGAVGISSGLIVATRPIDALFMWPLCLAIFISWYLAPASAQSHLDRRYKAGGVAILLLSFAFGPLLYVAFNYQVSGRPEGTYILTASSNGMVLSDIGEKLFSLLINGERVYGEANTGLIQRQPWILLFCMLLPFLCDRRIWQLTLMALTIALWFLIYMPYGDLLPTGMWRFYNIHYFTSAFPYLALLAFVGLRLFWLELRAFRRSRAWAIKTASSLLIGAYLVSVDFVEEVLWLQPTVGQNLIAIDRASSPTPTDFIDVLGAEPSSFESVYFSNATVDVIADDRRLTPVKEYRLTPIKGGTRLIFIRPQHWTSLTLSWADGVLLQEESPIIRAVSLSVGLGAALLDTGARKLYMVPERFGYEHSIQTSRRGLVDLLFDDGWHPAESWGRWSRSGNASLIFESSDIAKARGLELRLKGGLFVQADDGDHSTLHFFINGHAVSEIEHQENQFWRLRLPPHHLAPAGAPNRLMFFLDDVNSPAELDINADERPLGFGLASLEFSLLAE